MKEHSTMLILLVSIFLLMSTVWSQPDVGDQAPDFTLSDHKGNQHSLSDYEGKVVLLHFISCL